jgi:DNA ligase (NAD+)
MQSIEELVAKLQRANYAYHNNGEAVMGDDEYDRGMEELKRRAPSHPFLSVIGAPVPKGATVLPYTMASLDKVRFGEGGLVRWLKRQSVENHVIMEKLDGLSALYVSTVGCQIKGHPTAMPKVPNLSHNNISDGSAVANIKVSLNSELDGYPSKQDKLYLRGDGVKGVDVSRACPSLKIPKATTTNIVIRGEVLLPNASVPKGSIGRSLVNGYLHRILDDKQPVPVELSNCHFVAYQVIEPANMTRSQQMTWLQSRGFRIPNLKQLTTKELTEEKSKEILLDWRTNSQYPLDGIVIGTDTKPKASPGGEAVNPDDAVAFKASLDEQKEETTVIQVEWNLSRQNIWVPRIQIEPVEIGGATIQWLSGHNALAMEEGGIGPGARIIIRRSGDVIPTLDTVLEKARGGAAMPADGTWEWDERHVQALGKGMGESVEVQAKSIQHCLSTLGVEGVGPGLVKKLVEGGFTTMQKLWNAKPEELGGVIGAGRGPQLSTDLRKALETASQVSLLIASNCLPRGVGEKKLRSLYSICADASKWNRSVFGTIPAGWSEETLGEVLEAIPKAFTWIDSTFQIRPIVQQETKPVVTSSNVQIQYVCFTGVRDKELEANMESKGWVIEDSVTKKTNMLVVKDTTVSSGKTKKAEQLGIKISTVSQVKKEYMAHR